MWKINLPLRVPVSKKSDFIVNLNVYRNAHFLVLNKAKVTYKELVTPQIRLLPTLGKIWLEFTLFAVDKRLCDTSNICSIQEKFFCDALVESGKLSDDNYTIVKESRYNFGGVDRHNPRVEVTIYPFTEPKEENHATDAEPNRDHSGYHRLHSQCRVCQ